MRRHEAGRLGSCVTCLERHEGGRAWSKAGWRGRSFTAGVADSAASEGEYERGQQASSSDIETFPGTQSLANCKRGVTWHLVVMRGRTRPTEASPPATHEEPPRLGWQTTHGPVAES